MTRRLFILPTADLEFKVSETICFVVYRGYERRLIKIKRFRWGEWRVKVTTLIQELIQVFKHRSLISVIEILQEN
jgi:hypothetical protein